MAFTQNQYINNKRLLLLPTAWGLCIPVVRYVITFCTELISSRLNPCGRVNQSLTSD